MCNSAIILQLGNALKSKDLHGTIAEIAESINFLLFIHYVM